MMTGGARRMVAGMLHTICRQHSAKCGPPNDGAAIMAAIGRGEVVTIRDTPLADCIVRPRLMKAGATRMVAGMLLTIRC